MPDRAISDIIDSILGRPYQLRGRGPHAFDCLGVVLFVWDRLGEALPDPAGSQSVSEALSRFRERFVALPCLGCCEAGDVVHTSSGGLSEQGLAVVEDKRCLATAQPGVGVTRIGWPDIREGAGAQAYRLRSRC